MTTTIKIKRGLKANLAAAASSTALAEPVWTTDTKELWLGDGKGAVSPVGDVKSDLVGKPIHAGDVALYKDTTGKVLVPKSKAEFLAGYATESTVDSKIDHAVKNTTVSTATHATTATNSTQLGGKPASSFVQFGSGSNVTNSYTEDATNKVVSAKGVKSLNDALTSNINSVKNSYIPNSKKSSSITSTSQDTVATSKAVHDVNNTANSAHSLANSANSAASSAHSAADAAQRTANSANSTANTANSLANSNKTRLDNLPHHTAATWGPSGGKNGDVWLQY